MRQPKHAIILIGLLITTACTAAAEDVPSKETRSIAVVGSGAVAVVPDTATLQLGVETQAATARAALAANSTQTNNLIDALKEQGITFEQLTTDAINLNPRYEYPRTPNGSQQRKLVGYTSTNIVRVHITQLDQAGSLMDAAIEAGGNRIDGITFNVSNPDDALAQARQAAWENAYAQAQQLANLAGTKLGPVITIETQQNHNVRMEVMQARSLQSDTPVMGGQQEISARVNVRWQLL